MPPRIVIQVDVGRALNKLREAGIGTAKVEVEARHVASEVIRDRAVGYAPSPTSEMFPTERSTGRLRDSHEIREEGDKSIIQPMVHYAIYVHEGHFTPVKFVKGQAKPKATFIPPRPWLYHAVKDSMRDIEKLVEDLVQNALEEAEASVGRSLSQ